MRNLHIMLVVLLITGLGAFLRLNNFLESPPAFHIDESDIGYQAYSLMLTGRDYFGNFLPVHPQSFVDRRPFLYMYLLIPFIKVLGLNELAVRLPSALFGIGTIPLVFWLGKLLFDNTKRGLIFGLSCSFILATLTWHIHYSRLGYELTLLLFLYTLGLGTYLKWLQSSKIHWLSLSVLFLSLSLYVYSTAKLLTPLLILSLFIISFKMVKTIPFKVAFIIIFEGLIVCLPLVKDTLMGVGAERFAILSIFTDPNLKSSYLHLAWLSSYSTPYFPFIFVHPQTLSRIFLNQPLNFFYQILQGFWDTYSPQFLAFQGDPVNPRHVIPQSGMLGVGYSVLTLIGFVRLWFEKNRLLKTITLSLLILSPLPATLTRDGLMHGTRLFPVILPLTLLAGLAGLYLIENYHRLPLKPIIWLLIFFIGFEILRDQYIRLAVYPSSGALEFNYGWRQLVLKVDKYKSHYDYILIDILDKAPYQTLYAFYNKTDPTIFQEYAKRNLTVTLDDQVSKAYGNEPIYFADIDARFIPSSKLNPMAVIPSYKLNDQHVKVIDQVNGPQGDPLFYFVAKQ